MQKKPAQSKQSDAKMSSIEKKYGKDFGVPSVQMSTYLQNAGYTALGAFLKNE